MVNCDQLWIRCKQLKLLVLIIDSKSISQSLIRLLFISSLSLSDSSLTISFTIFFTSVFLLKRVNFFNNIIACSQNSGLDVTTIEELDAIIKSFWCKKWIKSYIPTFTIPLRIHLEFSTCPHNSNRLICGENPVLNANFKDFDIKV